MNLIEKKYYFFKLKTIGGAYQILNQALSKGLLLFEISPVGGGAHLALSDSLPNTNIENQGQRIFFKKILQNYSEEILFFKPLFVNEEVINAYLSLNNEAVMDFLLVFEHEFVGEVFEMASFLSSEGLKTIELRMPRGFQQKAHGFFTGEKSSLARIIQFKNENKTKYNFEIIENPHIEVRELFSFIK